MKFQFDNIAVIGSGNVGSHVVDHLSKKSEHIQVYSRNFDNAKELSTNYENVFAIEKISEIGPDSDAIIVAVKDDAIKSVAYELAGIFTQEKHPLVVHTSGSTPIDSLSAFFSDYGVLYPLQSFTKGQPVNFDKVHFFVEGSDDETTEKIRDLAKLFSKNVHIANSVNRNKLHIAAVFACNFANNMWTISDSILSDIGLDFSVMEEIVKTTLDKAVKMSPVVGQTGPARRKDYTTMRRQITLLPSDLKQLYSLISQSIIDYDSIKRP